MSVFGTLAGRLTSLTRYPWSRLSEGVSWLGALRERRRSAAVSREARRITLLCQPLSPEQKAQFDASKSFDVVGCHTGRRYRISVARGTNVREVDDAGRPLWVGVSSHPAI
jgi:hypothetical protein